MTLLSGGVSGSNLGSITPALLEIASTQTEIDNTYNEVAMDSTRLQAAFNKEQTNETREEGKKGANICYSQAFASFGSAFCDGLTTAATAASTSSLSSQLKAQSAELDQLESLQGNIQDKMTMSSPDIEMTELDAEGNPVRDGNVDSRIKEMQAGKIQSSNINHVQNENEAPLTEQAIEGANTDELNAIKGQTDDQVKNKTQSINTLQNQIQSLEAKVRMFGDMGKQIVNGGSQIGQAVFTDQKAQAQAAGLSDQFDQQIQATAAQTDQKAVADGQQQVLSVFQALAQAGQAMV